MFLYKSDMCLTHVAQTVVYARKRRVRVLRVSDSIGTFYWGETPDVGMDRRAFLVALTPLAAGCFGGQPSGSDTTATPAETSEPTATETPEPTATPTATATPEPEASEAAAELISTAQGQLSEAVYVYTGGVTGDLLSVTAETESFRAREVLLQLDDIQRTLAEAEAEATTEEQRTTVEAIDTMQRFLTHATDAQSWLIDGHDALGGAFTRMDDGDLDAAEDDVEQVETAVDQLSAPMDTIGAETANAPATAVDAIGENEYGEKVAQLTDESELLTALADDVRDIRAGIDLLARARDEIDDDRTDRAANTADRAYETLNDVEDRLDDILDDLPERADAFEPVVEDLRYLASRNAADADTIYEQYS
jgi:hypothetical protein